MPATAIEALADAAGTERNVGISHKAGPGGRQLHQVAILLRGERFIVAVRAACPGELAWGTPGAAAFPGAGAMAMDADLAHHRDRRAPA